MLSRRTRPVLETPSPSVTRIQKTTTITSVDSRLAQIDNHQSLKVDKESFISHSDVSLAPSGSKSSSLRPEKDDR